MKLYRVDDDYSLRKSGDKRRKVSADDFPLTPSAAVPVPSNYSRCLVNSNFSHFRPNLFFFYLDMLCQLRKESSKAFEKCVKFDNLRSHKAETLEKKLKLSLQIMFAFHLFPSHSTTECCVSLVRGCDREKKNVSCQIPFLI